MKTSVTVSLSMLSLISVLASSSTVTINTTLSPRSQEGLRAHTSDGAQNTTSHFEPTDTTATNFTETMSGATSPTASTHSTIPSTSGGLRGKIDSTPKSPNPRKTEFGMVFLIILFLVFLFLVPGLLFLSWWLWRPQGRRSATRLMGRARDAIRAAVAWLRLRLWPRHREHGTEEYASNSSLGEAEMDEVLKVGKEEEGQTEGQSSTDGEEEQERAIQMETPAYNDVMTEDNENQEDDRDLTIL